MEDTVKPTTPEQWLAHIKSDYSWGEAFAYADPDKHPRGFGAMVSNGELASYYDDIGCLGVSRTPFSPVDVVRVVAASEVITEVQDEELIGVFELRDGRFASLAAGCGYTGWEARGGGKAMVAGSEAEIVRYGLTKAERELLGLVLPDEIETSGSHFTTDTSGVIPDPS